MGFEQPVDHGIDFSQFLIGQPGNELLHQPVIGKHLKITNDGFLIGFSVPSKGGKPIIGFNKIMVVFFHPGFTNQSLGRSAGASSKAAWGSRITSGT